eukprot:13509607-Alexandrium_andersonii.AAC.1
MLAASSPSSLRDTWQGHLARTSDCQHRRPALLASTKATWVARKKWVPKLAEVSRACPGAAVPLLLAEGGRGLPSPGLPPN